VLYQRKIADEQTCNSINQQDNAIAQGHPSFRFSGVPSLDFGHTDRHFEGLILPQAASTNAALTRQSWL
jgi:hypothetical protein